MPPSERPPRDNLVRAIFPGAELRADSEPPADGRLGTLTGHFAVFNSWTEIDSMFEGRFMERIAPGAFKKTFRENRDGMRVLFNHGRDPSVGSKVLGPIEDLREDEVGAAYEARLDDTSFGRDLLPGLRAKQYGASFRFSVMKEALVMKPGVSDYNPEGLPERTIQEARVAEFGPVTFPAYLDATAGVRSMTDIDFIYRMIGAPERTLGLLESVVGDALPPTEPAETTPLEGSRAAEETPAPEPTPVPVVTPAGAGWGANVARQFAAGTATRNVPSIRSRQMPAPIQYDFSALDELRSLSEIDIARDERRSRLQALDAEHAGRQLGPDQAEWDRLDAELIELDSRYAAQADREARLQQMGTSERHTEPGDGGAPSRYSPAPAPRAGSHRMNTDIMDVAEIRAVSRTEDEYGQLLRDNAMRRIERDVFPHPDAQANRVRSHIERLLGTIDAPDPEHGKVGGELARRILHTGSPTYRRAIGKYLTSQGLTPEEQRALSIGSGAGGGFAVVYTLDPTIVPTSNYSVNPYRAISRVETISGTNEWKAVTSGAITAAYSAEATESSDNAPTLAQPDIIVEKAQAYVPFSIEVGQDWSSLQTEMAALLQDAKDDLEATKFTSGAGHGSNEPKGIITAATATTTAGGAAAFAIADLYKVFEALPPRFRPRASWIGNLFTYDKVRQFDTAGGSGVWIAPQGLQPGVGANDSGPVQIDVGARLLGKPAYEATAMTAALTTGSKILVIGDFRYFVIVDRIGMNIEVLPLVVGTNHRPTGQRGLYAYWRNSSDALSAAAFQVLVTG